MPKSHGRIRRTPISSDPPHRALNRAVDWASLARGMVASIPYFRSDVVADAAVTKELDATLADLDRALNRLCRLRADLGWHGKDD